MGHGNHDHHHDHSHNHDHEHAHQHCAEHGHCHGNCEGCGGDPKAELAAVMKYMVGHNTAHANELVALANKLKQVGDVVGYQQVMAAVSDYEKGNMRLSAVLAAMNIPQ